MTSRLGLHLYVSILATGLILSRCCHGLCFSSNLKIILTREKGKNDKLRRCLENNLVDQTIDIEEIPCIEHTEGPDSHKLIPFLQRQKYSSFTSDYVVITSPEAAHIFSKAYQLSNCPYIGEVAAVGKATCQTLEDLGIKVSFIPSKATAKTLVKELPSITSDSPTRVFYPASLQAQNTLQDGLSARGFEVTRLNTYDTIPSVFTDEQVLLASSATVVCFGSPSAVKAFVKNLGKEKATKIPAVCIGETSAKACREMTWTEDNIFYPSKPGIEGWAKSVADAIAVVQTNVLQ